MTRDEYFPSNGPTSPMQIARIGNECRQGYLDVTVPVIVENGTSVTMIEDQRVRATTVPLLVPLSADAANMVWWMEGAGRGFIEIGHSTAGSDLEFRAVLIG